MFANVPLVKRPQKFQPPFSPAEVRALLDAQDRDTLTGCRNYTLLLFLLDTGVRASECLGVQLEDIDWAHPRVLVRHGKGGKQRWVGSGERALGALRDYVERFRGDRPGEEVPASSLLQRGYAAGSPGSAGR